MLYFLNGLFHVVATERLSLIQQKLIWKLKQNIVRSLTALTRLNKDYFARTNSSYLSD